MMYGAAPHRMCRKISKFDNVPNPTWQVVEVGERVSDTTKHFTTSITRGR